MFSYFISLLNILLFVSAQKFMIQYGGNGQSADLFKYLNGKENGLYVNIGADHPLINSSSAFLYTRNWQGVNTNSKLQKLMLFYTYRIYDTNINMIVRDDKKFMNINEMISDEITLAQMSEVNTVEAQQSQIIPSLSLGSLCERYYTKKPMLMIVGQQATLSLDLNKNKWENPKCRPDIIFYRLHKKINVASQSNISKTLIKHDYTLTQSSEYRQIYIENSFVQHYQRQKINNQIIMNQRVIMNLSVLINQLSTKLKISNWFSPNHGQAQAQIQAYLSRDYEPIMIRKLQKLAQTSKTDKILIFEFNSSNSYFVLQHSDYYLRNFTLQGGLNLFQLNIYNPNRTLKIYIIDHRYGEPGDTISVRILCQNKEDKQTQSYKIGQLNSRKIIFKVITILFILLLFFLCFKRIQRRKENRWEKLSGAGHEKFSNSIQN